MNTIVVMALMAQTPPGETPVFESLSLDDRKLLFNRDFKKLTGRRPSHFHCPILGVDQKTELIKGHIIPENQKVSNIWIPQRADVDAFYGTAAEADFDFAARAKTGSVSVEDLFTGKEPRGPKIHLELEGEELPYFLPQSTENLPDDFTVGKLEMSSGSRDIAFKVSEDVLFKQETRELKLRIDRDFTPEMAATVLKAAHLTMFAIDGYSWFFSAAGQLLSDILKRPFEEIPRLPRPQRQGRFQEMFREHLPMVRPLWGAGQSSIKGTIIDRHCLACMGASGEVWAIAVQIPMRSDLFSVFLPTDSRTALETYFGFLRQPSDAITVRNIRATESPPGRLGEYTWQMSPTDERIPLAPI